MKETTASIEFKFLDTVFRARKHFGSNIIEIEKQVSKSLMKTGFGWERIYFGHTDPLEKALEFFRNNNPTPKETT